jgi:hypothetical protein
MNHDDVKELIEILDMLAEGIGGIEMTALKYKFYEAALSDLTIEQIREAAVIIARTATFYPKPVDFRKAIEGNIDDKAILAWDKALAAKNKYDSVKFDDPVIHSAIEAMGGWIKFCTMEDYKEEKWQMTDFTKIYKAMINRGEHPDYLSGMVELENSARGFVNDVPTIKLIGNAEPVKKIEHESKLPVKVDIDDF